MSEINVTQPALSEGSATLPGMGHLLGHARVSITDQGCDAAAWPVGGGIGVASSEASTVGRTPGGHRLPQGRDAQPS